MYKPYDSENYPVRKNPRIKGYNYAALNYYFITVCTKNKKCILGEAGAVNELGSVVQRAIEEIPAHYSGVCVDKFVVMPNHIHAIIILYEGKSELTRIVGSFKSYVTKKAHEIYPDLEVWQTSFHDHVIRSQKSYETIWLYIDSNPDCKFRPNGVNLSLRAV